MRIKRTIQLFNDVDKELKEGDTVTIETLQYGIYLGNIYSIRNNIIILVYGNNEKVSIRYVDIKIII